MQGHLAMKIVSMAGGLIFAFLVQAACLFVWGGRIDESVEKQGSELVKHDKRITAVEEYRAATLKDLATLTERSAAQSKQLDRIEQRLVDKDTGR